MSREKLRAQCRRLFDHEGDGIEGERVIAMARSIGKPIVVAGTSTHQIQQVILKTNVLCMIDRAFRYRGDGPMQLREPPEAGPAR